MLLLLLPRRGNTRQLLQPQQRLLLQPGLVVGDVRLQLGVEDEGPRLGEGVEPGVELRGGVGDVRF